MLKEINGRKFKLLIKSPDIADKVGQIAVEITKDYEGKNLLVIGILKGSFIFLADLLRQTDMKVELDFIGVSSYKNDVTPGNIELTIEPTIQIKGRNVLIVEDLQDSGGTLDFIRSYVLKKEPLTLKICTLIKKRKYREKSIEADYSGFEIDDQFIVGYGMDYAEQGRNLPDIYVVES